MSSDQAKHQTSVANQAGDFGSPVNTSSKVSKNSSDDTSDSPSSIIEEIIDNGNETANDDDIDNISEHAPKLEHTTIAQRANETSIQHQSNDSTKIDTAAALPTSKCKSTATVRLKSKSEVKQKTAVIKAKTPSPVNSYNKLKSAKSSVKQASILQADGNKDKHRSNAMDATTSTTSPLPQAQPPSSSTSKSIEVKGSNSTKPLLHEMKSVYATPASPTASGGFNTLKTDLPGRVSFSKNDVYEIDYSDIDNDTDTSRSFDLNETFRKKNVHFEDEYFNKYDDDEANDDATTTNNDTKKMSANQMSMFRSNENRMSTVQETSESNSLLNNDKDYCPMKCSSLRCKADMRLDVLPEDNENGSNVAISNDSSQKIIDEYKREIESINRQHELERRWNGGKVNGDTTTNSEYLNSVSSTQRSEFKDTEQNSSQKDEWQSGSDTWSSPNHETNENAMGKSKATNTNAAASNTSDESPTRDSASTVINNYLKITNQRTGNSTKPSSATIKLKTTKKLAGTTNRKIKSAQVASSTDNKPSTSNRLTKAKSVGHLQRVTDIKLSEFQIDKVESWMSTHEDTFSDTGLNSYRKYGKFGSSSNLDYKKTWRETPTSKTDDEGNYSLDDQVDNTSMDGSIGGGIELVLKKLEGRRMQISFGKFEGTFFFFKEITLLINLALLLYI